MKEQKDCPYKGQRIMKFDPPVDVKGVVIHELPTITCNHIKRIKDDCVILEGNIHDCGYINENKGEIK
jgi:hypothetical protein